jgi:hypothetical protein
MTSETILGTPVGAHTQICGTIMAGRHTTLWRRLSDAI